MEAGLLFERGRSSAGNPSPPESLVQSRASGLPPLLVALCITPVATGPRRPSLPPTIAVASASCARPHHRSLESGIRMATGPPPAPPLPLPAANCTPVVFSGGLHRHNNPRLRPPPVPLRAYAQRPRGPPHRAAAATAATAAVPPAVATTTAVAVATVAAALSAARDGVLPPEWRRERPSIPV